MKKKIYWIIGAALAAALLIIAAIFGWKAFFAAPRSLHQLKAEEVAQAGMYTMDGNFVACTLNQEDISALVDCLNEGKFKRVFKGGDASYGTWSAPFFFQMQDHSVLKITLNSQYLLIDGDRYQCDEATRAKLMEYFDRNENLLRRK